jgi:hypothetical protein
MQVVKMAMPEHTSVSALKDAMRCFYLYSTIRVFRNMPPVTLLENVAYGINAHAAIDTLGKAIWKDVTKNNRPIKHTDYQGIINGAANMLYRQMCKGIGPRDNKGEMQVLQWFKDGKSVKDKIGMYQGKLMNALRAFRLQFTEPVPYTHLEFEKPFSLPLRLGDWMWRADGRIDIVEHYPEKLYRIGDYKTGAIIRIYDNYTEAVKDIQFTMYDEALTREYDIKPEGLFVQPLDFSGDQLAIEQLRLLSKIRKPIPARTEHHFPEIVKLAKDVHDVITSVVQPYKFDEKSRKEWVALSEYGKLDTTFKESIERVRFIPSPTQGCNGYCQRYELCRKENPDIWERYESNRQVPEQHGKPMQIEYRPKPEPEVIKMPLLEGIGGKMVKSGQNLPKNERLMRKDYLATGNFISRGLVKIVGFKLVENLLERTMCRCFRLKLVGRWEFRYLDPNYDPEKKHFGHLCTIEGCKFRDDSCPCANSEKS